MNLAPLDDTCARSGNQVPLMSHVSDNSLALFLLQLNTTHLADRCPLSRSPPGRTRKQSAACRAATFKVVFGANSR